jgi:hypothetical protein
MRFMVSSSVRRRLLPKHPACRREARHRRGVSRGGVGFHGACGGGFRAISNARSDSPCVSARGEMRGDARDEFSAAVAARMIGSHAANGRQRTLQE